MERKDLISKIMENGERQLFELIDDIYNWEDKNELKEIILSFAKVKCKYEQWKEKAVEE